MILSLLLAVMLKYYLPLLLFTTTKFTPRNAAIALKIGSYLWFVRGSNILCSILSIQATFLFLVVFPAKSTAFLSFITTKLPSASINPPNQLSRLKSVLFASLLLRSEYIL